MKSSWSRFAAALSVAFPVLLGLNLLGKLHPSGRIPPVAEGFAFWISVAAGVGLAAFVDLHPTWLKWVLLAASVPLLLILLAAFWLLVVAPLLGLPVTRLF